MPSYTEVLVENEASAAPFLLVPSIEGPEVRSVFETRRNDNPPPQTSDDEQELKDLRKLLRAQEIARARAQDAVVEAQRKLKSFETETKRVSGDLRRAKEQLADAKDEHTRDLQRAKETEAGLWNELADARAQVTKAQEKVSGYRKFVVLSPLLLIPIISWAAVKYWPSVPQGDKARTEMPRSSPAALPSARANVPPGDFMSDTRRLEQALSYFGNQSPENVLRKVHDANAAHGISVCTFEWNGGQVSLLFGDKPGAGLGSSLTQCADAVEQAATQPGR